MFGIETSEILWQKSHFFQYILKFQFLKKQHRDAKRRAQKLFLDALKNFPISPKGETIETNTRKITLFEDSYKMTIPTNNRGENFLLVTI